MAKALVVTSRCLFSLLAVGAIAATIACGGTGGGGGSLCGGAGGFTVHVSDINANGVVTGDDLGATAYGSLYQTENGTQGCVPGFGSSNNFLPLPWPVPGGEAPAIWSGSYKASCVDPIIFPNGQGYNVSLALGDPINPNGGGPVNRLGSCPTGAAASFFALSGSIPSTITVPGTGLSTKYGSPRLQLSSIRANGTVSASSAIAVAANGTSATFSFPLNAQGQQLSNGLYGYILQNQTAPGVYKPVDSDALAIGSSSTLPAPYGVDALNSSTTTETCIDLPRGPRCTFSTATTILPLVTLVNSAQLNYAGSNIPVGNQPTAVKAYHNAVTTYGTIGTDGYTRITQPTRALVANSGSNTVSVVTLLPTTGVSATINVGTQPVAILIDGAQTYAYVTNLASGTVSQISLSSNTVTGTVSVGSMPTSLAMDPSGTAVWVGGANFISKVNTSNLSIATTYAVSGQVTSLSVSAGQNSYVYTVVSGTTFTGAHAALSNGVAHADYSMRIGGASVKPPSSGLPSWLNIGGPLVSASYGNRYIVEGTPSGFAVLDLQINKVMMQGTTAAPIVGIAVDPQNGTAYATETNANTLLSIPLPPVQLN